MKYFVILILIGFAVITSAGIVYGMWFPQSPEKLFEQSETVFVGTVTSVNFLEFERSNTRHIEENGIPRIEIENYTQTLDEYTVHIEEFLKNPQTSNTITMLEATVGGVPGRNVSIGGFELGDRVLFYVPNIDGTNQYSPESFKIPKPCDAKSVLEQPRVFLFNDFKIMQDGVAKNDNFIANKPIEFVYNKDMDTLEGKNFDVNIKISKITGNDWETALQENIHTESKLCEWTSTANWKFVPTSGRYYMWMQTSEGNNTGVETLSGGFTVKEFDFPLKQLKSGIPVDKIKCNESLTLVLKYDGSPTCVKLETKIKLIQRGWATDPMFYGLTKSQITDIQLAKLGCKKTGNQTYCDKMVQDKIEYYLKQNKLNTKLESESSPEPEPELNPIPEEYHVESTTKQDQYTSPFDEEWIHKFQENYHTVITGKVIDVFGQKPPTKYDYQYRVEALAHHTPRIQDDSIYKIFGNDDEFVVPINADVVLFGLDIDDEGLLYIVKTVVQEKPQP